MFNFVSYFKIRKILKKEKCEAVITNNLMGMGFLTPLAIRSLKIKHLHIAHDIQLIYPSGLMYYGKERVIDSFFAKIYTSICNYLFASPPTVIFPSVWLKDLYLKRKFFANSKINVLPNPVDFTKTVISTPAIEPGEKSLKDENCKYKGFLSKPALSEANVIEMTIKISFKFLYLGQIEKHKGIFLLIEAFNKLKAKYPEVELLIVGTGSKIKIVQECASINNNIKFLGWPGDEEADKLLFSCNCLVYPSLVYENCPNAIQRALMADLPIIASNLGGIPELLGARAGILFKPAKADDLTEKMEWIIKNKNNSRAYTKVSFKTENYIKKLIEVFISSHI